MAYLHILAPRISPSGPMSSKVSSNQGGGEVETLNQSRLLKHAEEPIRSTPPLAGIRFVQG